MPKIRRSVRLTPEEDKRADDARWKLRLSWQDFLLQAVEELVKRTNTERTLDQVFDESKAKGESDG